MKQTEAQRLADWLQANYEADEIDDAAMAQHSVYQLPDDLYPDSKCWVDGTYAERVEWLHTMYESSKQTLNVLLGQQDVQAVPPKVWPDVKLPKPELLVWRGGKLHGAGFSAKQVRKCAKDYALAMLNARPQPQQDTQAATCKQDLQVDALLDEMLDTLPYNSPDYWIGRIREVRYGKPFRRNNHD